MNFIATEREPLSPLLKGLASSAIGQPLDALGGLGLSVLADQLPFPIALLRDSAVTHNLDWMRGFTERADVVLCPHGKTTMSPQLFARQLAAGCWGLTAATAAHVRTYRRFGAKRVILANQLVGAANIDLVFDELTQDPDFDLYVLVDSVAGLDLLLAAAVRRRLGRPLQLLLEIGAPGGRAGVRTLEEGVAVGRAVRDASPLVALRGVEAFEGIAGGANESRAELAVYAMLDTLGAVARAGVEEGWFAPGEVLLTAGGSAFFDIAARALPAFEPSRARVVLRSGCYITHDALHYARMQARMRQRSTEFWGAGPGLKNALEVWSVVQSVPEAGRAIVALGKRDISYDLELPKPLWWFRHGHHRKPEPVDSDLRVTLLNDQHAYVDASAGAMPWRVGDLVGFGVGHPCTTFDKWAFMYTVDDSYRVTGGIRTYF